MAAGSLEIKEGVQELNDPLHPTIFYHHQQNELEDNRNFGNEERSVDVSEEIQGNGPLHHKSLLRKSFRKRSIKKWLKKKVLRTSSHAFEGNVQDIEKKGEAYDKGEGMEQIQHGENQVAKTEEEIIKIINSNSKELLFNEEVDSVEVEIKSFIAQLETENTPQDKTVFSTEIIMAHRPKSDLLEKIKDDTALRKENPLPSDTEIFVQESSFSPVCVTPETINDANKEQEEESVNDKKNDPVSIEVFKKEDEHQEEDIVKAFDKQRNDTSSSDNGTTTEEESDMQSDHEQHNVEQKGTDDQHNKRLVVFALLSLLLVYLYISSSF